MQHHQPREDATGRLPQDQELTSAAPVSRREFIAASVAMGMSSILAQAKEPTDDTKTDNRSPISRAPNTYQEPPFRRHTQEMLRADLHALSDAFQKFREWGKENPKDMPKNYPLAECESHMHATGDPDVEALERLYGKIATGSTTFESAWQKDVRDALRKVILTMRAMGNPKVEEYYHAQIGSLMEHLQRYGENPTTQEASNINLILSWLRDLGQAPELIETIRRDFGKPNLAVTFSKPFMNATVPSGMPFQDPLLRDAMAKEGLTSGTIRLELIANGTAAEIHLLLSGKGGGTMRTIGHVSLFADKEGIRTRKPVLQGEHPDIFSLMEKDGMAVAKRSDERFQEDFRKAFQKLRIFPDPFAITTTENELRVVGMEAGPAQLGAPNAIPAHAVNGMLVRIHESAINNTTDECFSGVTLMEGETPESLRRWMLPEKKKETDETEGSTFAQRRPIVVEYGNNRINVAIRFSHFSKGDRVLPGIDTSAMYRLEKRPDGMHAVWEHEIELLPPRLAKKSGNLSAREIQWRTLLRPKLEWLLPKDMRVDDLVLPGPLAMAGKLRLKEWTTNDGWMTLDWERTGDAPPTGEQKWDYLKSPTIGPSQGK